MSFEIKKMGKLGDQLEQQAYDWVLPDIQEYFGVENISDLTRENLQEIERFLNSDAWIEGYVEVVLRTIIDNFE